MIAERCRLYLITPPVLEPETFPDRLAAALDGGDVACLQLRLKGAGDDALRRTAEALMPVCHGRGVAFLINDRPDIAAACGADGVHVGAEDTPYDEARRLVGADAIVGVSCYDSRHQAMSAAEAGADYVAFGAFFPTATKSPPARAELDLLRWWQDLTTVPCVAIGGITTANAAALVEAGADFLAVISAVWDHPDGPGAAVAAFNRLIDDGQGN
ncbi:MAG: thiamine phosphate synthase [Alphaproteobacteria bacterium]|jgi:thiamine-phosphate pyrophosphorylase|nr:thiamine phosphate synthase [Alphaproteobacteria bacterium]MDP6515932.1 thiamine phosphate synthase [Alphaproteobacteria bacterium]